METKPITINHLFDLLKTNYNETIEEWWPYQSIHEMVIGAILVQNTTWHNTQISLEKIRTHNQFNPSVIRNLSTEELIELIYSSGFHQNKSKSIHSFFVWLKEFEDDYSKIKQFYGSDLRKQLLSLHGIGPETADVILLYAFKQPVFIADTYARRLFSQLKAPTANNYSDVKRFAEENGRLTVEEWGAFHGWIIRFAQNHLNKQQIEQINFLTPYHLIANQADNNA